MPRSLELRQPIATPFMACRLAAVIARDAGDLDTARRGLREAIDFAQRHPGAEPVAIAIARTELAELLANRDIAAARTELAVALPILIAALPEAAPSRQAAERLARRLMP